MFVNFERNIRYGQQILKLHKMTIDGVGIRLYVYSFVREKYKKGHINLPSLCDTPFL